MYQQSEKNLFSSNVSPTCPYNMVNFGPLAAEFWTVEALYNDNIMFSAAGAGNHVLPYFSIHFLISIQTCPLHCVIQPHSSWCTFWLFMAALCNRQAIIFLPCGFYLSFILSFFFSSPNLSDRRLDLYHTSTHGVALV